MIVCDSYILVINPGSTSTKVALFQGTQSVFQQDITHPTEELSKFEKIGDQFEYRKDVILSVLQSNQVDISQVKVVMGRGGLIKPVPSGVIAVDEKLKYDLQNSPIGQHASNLGGLIADDIARGIPNSKAYIANPVVVDEFEGLIADDIARGIPNSKAYIANPVVVDEFEPLARVAGHPLFSRQSIYHALNQKAIAYEYAQSRSKKYCELNLIVAHLGGGITVGAHRQGRVIDVNQGLDGEGPFSPERSGTLPMGQLISHCFSGKYTENEIRKMVTGQGGLMAYLGTTDARLVRKWAEEGNANAKLIFEAMAYQVSKDIGAMFTVLSGEVDAILLTGGIAYCHTFTSLIANRVKKLAPVHVYPGEDEMKALATMGARVLLGEIKPMSY